MIALTLAAALMGTQIPEAQQFVTEENGREVFPPAFRGRWAPTRAECDGDGLHVKLITVDRVYGYESESNLLQSSGLIYQTAPGGGEAYTILALTAWSAEGEVGIGRLRISRVGERLFTSNAEAVQEDEHWTHSNVRCPDPPRESN